MKPGSDSINCSGNVREISTTIRFEHSIQESGSGIEMRDLVISTSLTLFPPVLMQKCTAYQHRQSVETEKNTGGTLAGNVGKRHHVVTKTGFALDDLRQDKHHLYAM
jgi:hypothetical protein